MVQKVMFCHFLKEQAECCPDKVTSEFDIYLHASFKSWSKAWVSHMVEKSQKTFFSLDQIRAPFC